MIGDASSSATSEIIGKDAGNVKKNRAFTVLMLGSSISMFGSRISMVAFPMLVLKISGSPLLAGAVAFVAIAPGMLIYIPAGALVDRRRPSQTLLWSETGRGIAIAAVVAALVLGKRPPIYLLIVAMLAEEILAIFSTLAERRYISLVKRDDASRAQAYVEVRAHAVVLAGRPVGAVLFNISQAFPFIADGLSFIASVASLIVIRSRHEVIEPSPTMTKKMLRRDIREGFRWFQQDQPALMTAVLMSCTTLIAQALILIFLAAANEEKLPSLAIGVVLAASGAGGALGAVIGGCLPAKVKGFWLPIQMSTSGLAIGLVVTSGRHWFIWTVGAMLILGFTGAIGNIEFGTYLVENVPNGMLARVTGVGKVLAIGATSLGPVLGGSFVEGSNVHSAASWLLLIILLMALFSFYPLLLRKGRVPRFLRFAPATLEAGQGAEVQEAISGRIGPLLYDQGRPFSTTIVKLQAAWHVLVTAPRLAGFICRKDTRYPGRQG